MATWHQQQANKRNPVRLDHDTEWTVVIDPPHQMRACMSFTSRDLAEVYMRNLRANNPVAAQHAYILPPRERKGYADKLRAAGKNY